MAEPEYLANGPVPRLGYRNSDIVQDEDWLHGERLSVFNDRRPKPEPKPKPFRHTHVFEPKGLDSWDPRPHPGSKPIAPGTPVKRVSQMGKGRLAFHIIEDEAGNRMSVWKQSLTPKQPKRKAP